VDLSRFRRDLARFQKQKCFESEKCLLFELIVKGKEEKLEGLLISCLVISSSDNGRCVETIPFDPASGFKCPSQHLEIAFKLLYIDSNALPLDKCHGKKCGLSLADEFKPATEFLQIW